MYTKCENLCGQRGRKRFIASWGLRMSHICPYTPCPSPQGYRSKVESRHFAHHWDCASAIFLHRIAYFNRSLLYHYRTYLSYTARRADNWHEYRCKNQVDKITVFVSSNADPCAGSTTSFFCGSFQIRIQPINQCGSMCRIHNTDFNPYAEMSRYKYISSDWERKSISYEAFHPVNVFCSREWEKVHP